MISGRYPSPEQGDRQQAVFSEVAARGRITFARFMELALYAPEQGYYAREHTAPDGDYFTSPRAHPVFGALLALQLQQMWGVMGRPATFTIVEPGGGDGRLARDIVQAPNLDPSFRKAMRYVVLERRPVPCSTGSYGADVERVCAVDIPLRGVVGCVLSNELLDAFPVHRFVMQEGRVKELYVTLDARGGLAGLAGEPSSDVLASRLQRLRPHLAEGQIGEVNLAMERWIGSVARALHTGFVLTIDYGYPARLLYSAERAHGTLRSYYRHNRGSDPFVHVGNQDMTAHVDFTSFALEGRRHGLRRLGLTTQREFLFNLGMEGFMKALAARRLPREGSIADQMALRQLVQPDGLGALRVMIQGKNIGRPKLHGLVRGSSLRECMEEDYRSLEVPRLTAGHMQLLEGAYPHQAASNPGSQGWHIG